MPTAEVEIAGGNACATKAERQFAEAVGRGCAAVNTALTTSATMPTAGVEIAGGNACATKVGQAFSLPRAGAA